MNQIEIFSNLSYSGRIFPSRFKVRPTLFENFVFSCFLLIIYILTDNKRTYIWLTTPTQRWNPDHLRKSTYVFPNPGPGGIENMKLTALNWFGIIIHIVNKFESVFCYFAITSWCWFNSSFGISKFGTFVTLIEVFARSEDGFINIL